MLVRVRRERRFDRRTMNVLSFAIISTSIIALAFPNNYDKLLIDGISALNILLSIIILIVGYELYAKDHDGLIARTKLFIDKIDEITANENCTQQKLKELAEEKDRYSIELFRTDINFVIQKDKKFFEINLIEKIEVFRCRQMYYRYHLIELIRIILPLLIIAIICILSLSYSGEKKISNRSSFVRGSVGAAQSVLPENSK